MGEFDDNEVLEHLTRSLDILMDGKPNDRSDKDRRYAIAITDMEKVIAYFKTYVINVPVGLLR